MFFILIAADERAGSVLVVLCDNFDHDVDMAGVEGRQHWCHDEWVLVGCGNVFLLLAVLFSKLDCNAIGKKGRDINVNFVREEI